MSLHDMAWTEVFADLETQARAAVRATLERLDISGPLEVSLVFTDDAEQRTLNRDYRHKDSATNVLSFPNMADDAPLADGLPRLLGDVVLARETVEREAHEQGKRPTDHAIHLIVHGTLHLLDYDHQQADAAAEMEALEIEILTSLGIADPYAAAAAVQEASHG